MGVRLEGTGGSLRLSDVTGDLRWKDWEHSQTVKKKKPPFNSDKYLLTPSENEVLKCTE